MIESSTYFLLLFPHWSINHHCTHVFAYLIIFPLSCIAFWTVFVTWHSLLLNLMQGNTYSLLITKGHLTLWVLLHPLTILSLTHVPLDPQSAEIFNGVPVQAGVLLLYSHHHLTGTSFFFPGTATVFLSFFPPPELDSNRITCLCVSVCVRASTVQMTPVPLNPDLNFQEKPFCSTFPTIDNEQDYLKAGYFTEFQLKAYFKYFLYCFLHNSMCVHL